MIFQDEGERMTATTARPVEAETAPPEVASGANTTPPAPHDFREKIAAWTGRLVTLAAFWSLIKIPIRGWHWTDRIDDVFGLVNLPAAPSLFVVLVLFLLGSALRRRLRAAWLILFIFEVLAVVTQAAVAIVVAPSFDRLPTDDVDLTRYQYVLIAISAVLGLVVIWLLWLCRRRFPARLARGSWLAALAVLISGLIVSTLVTFLITEASPRDLTSTGEKLRWSLRASLGILGDRSESALHGHHGHHWVEVIAGLLSALALLAAVAVFLRSSRAKQFLGAQDELRVRRMVLEHGERDSLGYFATRRDKSVIFSPDGRAAVTFRVVASVSLASADPVGAPASWPAAIDAWLQDARSHGWFPAALSASESGAEAYVNAGLKALTIGDEAILDVDSFSLEGRTMRPIRQPVTRVRRAGYSVQARRHADIPAAELAEFEKLAEQWRGDDTERGFSMALNRLGDPADGRCVMVTAHDHDGTVRGLLSFVPWGRTGLSLDLMRRDKNAENGLTEFMVTGLIEAGGDLGVKRISLNFAMFRSVFSSAERVGAGPILKLTDAVLSVASKFWQIETLYRSNAKYLPNWVPRFMCYDSGLTLTRAAIASGMAEGFLPAPAPKVARSAADTVEGPDGQPMPFAEAVEIQTEELRRLVRPMRRLTEQQRVRRDKISRLSESGQQAYPVTVPRTTTIPAVREQFPDLAPDAQTGTVVSLTGRVRALRDLGGVTFAQLYDDGQHVQVMLTADHTPAECRTLFKRTVDLGDHISVTGEVITSHRGELSVLIDEWVMASKCLRPLPDLHAGFSDPDARVRQRYLDLMVNPESLQLLQQRSVAVRAVRDAFTSRGYLEVETPMLQAVHGGASARPFRTHINAYNTDLYLRIAPELFLKRLCVGGMGRVFEMNRNFRNEGADATHNPEFTSVEAYQAYADYNVMRELTRELIIEVATAVYGEPIAMRPDADGRMQKVDLSGPWPVKTVHQAVSDACGVTLTSSTPLAELHELCLRLDIHIPTDATAGELVAELYDEFVEKQTTFPTFYTDFPVETSPLTRVHRVDPALSERWDLVAFGAEIGTAYSELVDPIDQRERLTEQSIKAAAGDPEAMQIDEAFLTALEYAMPPTGGLGIGVDRLVMMLTGSMIRSTLAFPFVRPQTSLNS
jgi:lysyl-tRNA synthetase class 2